MTSSKMAGNLLHMLQFTPEMQTDSPVQTSITGEIPEWVRGTLYRNGSGMFQIGDTTLPHLFDGMSVLHKFVIEGGKVFYQNKLLDSSTLQKSLKYERLMANQFSAVAAPDPCKNIFARYFSYFTPTAAFTDNTAVNVVPHGDLLVALTEQPFLNIIDQDTLGTKDTLRIPDVLAVHLATAHPQTDEDGSMYNLGTCFNPMKAYSIIKIPPQEKGEEFPIKRATIVATIPSRWKLNVSYNHSFGMSSNYFIFLEQTLTINVFKLPLIKLFGFAACTTDYPEEKSIIHLLGRTDGKEVDVRYVTDGFFCFHFVNCYEDGGHVVVDVIGFDNASVINDLYLSALKKKKLECLAKFRRYVLPLDVGKMSEKTNLVTLKDTSATAVKQADDTIFCTPDYIVGGPKEGVMMELPRINHGYNTRKYRYAYGTGFLSEYAVLTKLDIESKKVLEWRPESDDQPGEPVFVPRPGATEEDDGVILSPVMPTEPGRQAFLLLLDAKTFKELGRAVAPPGVKMPVTFHGSFIPE